METVFKYKSCYLKILTWSKFHFPLWYDEWGFFGWNWHLIITSRQKKAGKILNEFFHIYLHIWWLRVCKKKICWRYFFKALIFMPSKWIGMIGESFIRHPKEFLSSLGKSRDALGCSSDGLSIFRSSFRTCNLFWWYILPTTGNCCALNYAKGEKRRQKLIYFRSRFQGFM